MVLNILLFVSFCFFPILVAEDIPSKINRAQLEDYVKDLVEAKVKENVAARDLVRQEELRALQARDLVRQEELRALQARLNQAESRNKFQDLELQELKAEATSQNKHNALLASKRFVMNAGYPVGFMACVSVSDLTNLGDKHMILFDKVFTNTGGAYHNHTGIFTAPFKGLYAFHLSAMTSPGKAQALAFVKDGTVLSLAYPHGSGTNTYQTAGHQWVVELDQGSEVWIQTYHSGEIHGNCYTAFSGFIISEME